MKKINELPWFFIVQIITAVFFIGFMVHRAQPENCINYGNEDYYFVMVSVGSGRSEEIYTGTIENEDYEKWVNGETGTIFLYSAHLPGRGWRLNLAHIKHITNYGSKPSYLPLNFGK